MRADAVSGDLRSNIAAARHRVRRRFTTDACVVGVIFADRNGTVSRDPGEPGVMSLHFEEGTSPHQRPREKCSYCGLTRTTHVLKVDRTTLPAGAKLTASSNRNAGDASSLFVDLKFGEVHRTDFIIDASADPTVLDDIDVRRARAEVWAPKFEDPARAAITGGRPAVGNSAASRVGSAGMSQAPTQGQTIGGFEPIRQLAGLSPANSNAPEPLPAAADAAAAKATNPQGVTSLSTALRPMLAVALLDGVVSFSKVNGGLLAPAPGRGVRQEFTLYGIVWRQQGPIRRARRTVRQGAVGTRLLTLAYDSDKDERGVLFRDIQPDAFYPIYGDSSEKRFDAQRRTFLRVDVDAAT